MSTSSPTTPTKRNELFGVFGDRDEFERHRSAVRFGRVIETDLATIGVRDLAYGLPNRTVAHEAADGACVVWGECISETGGSTAAALYERFGEVGSSAFDDLNGSYLAYVERDGDAMLATDPIRSRECFYTDAPGVRAFGTDAAAVAGTVPDPTVDERGVAEMAHFGVVFGDRTTVRELARVPFDGYLTPTAAGELDRFVYDPRPPESFDPVAELADRLERAIARRATLPGRQGVLMGGDYDARLLVAANPNVDVSYTLGTADADEVAVARRVARRYGVDHELLPVSDTYFDLRPEVLRYTNGIRESYHIHHRGNNEAITADSVYHGLLFDTLFAGAALPRAEVDVFGHSVPLSGLDPEPDVVERYADRFGFPDAPTDGRADLPVRGTEAFARETLEPLYERSFTRADDEHNAFDLVAVRAKPRLSFRTHLADHYVESFVAADRELLNWHLQTPPEHRTARTFRQAVARVDPDVLHPRPPNRPHGSRPLNAVEGAVRDSVPGLASFDTPWPDRDDLYERNDLDRKLFPGYSEVHSLDPQVKLRMNDLTTWLESATGRSRCTPDELLRPPASTADAAPSNRADGGENHG